MSNPYEPGPLAGAGESLVGALLGGDAVREKARQTEQMRLYQEQGAEATVDKKITEAFLERDKRKAQQSYEANLTPIMGEQNARIAAGFAVGGDANLEQVQKFGLRAQIPGAMEADGVTHGNALVMALGNKLNPSISNVAGQNVRGLYGDAPTITDSDETLSKILAHEAQAGASNARARYTDMKTGAGAWNPNTGGSKAQKLTNYTVPSNAAMASVLDVVPLDSADPKSAKVVDPAQKRAFLSWQAEQADADPKYRDGEYAIAQWAGKKFASTPATVDGNQVDVPAGYSTDIIQKFSEIISARRAQGEPDLTKLQKRQILMNAKRNGGQISVRDSSPDNLNWSDGNGTEMLSMTARSSAAKTQPHGNEPSPLGATTAMRATALETKSKADRALAAGVPLSEVTALLRKQGHQEMARLYEARR